MKTCSPHQFREKKKEKKCWFCVVYERWMCCSMWVLCVLSLRKCLCLDKKKEKKKRITAFILAPFCLWPPDTDRWSIRSPPLRTRKKMFSTVFSESRVLPQKKTTFWILTKKAKSQTEKTPNCHKTKTRMKERKKIVKTTSHTTYSTHPIEAPQHTHTNSPKLHP